MSSSGFDPWLAHAPGDPSRGTLRRIDDLHAAVALYVNRGPLRAEERALTVTRFGSAIALRDLARPQEGRSNRVIAFEPDSLGVLEEIVRFYEDAGMPCQLDVLPSRWPAVGAALQARGFELRGSACTSSGAPTVRAPVAPAGVQVESVTERTIGDALAIRATVLGQAPPPPEVVDLRRAELAEHRDYRICLARVEGEPAALGSVFFHERGAYLAGAMTLPSMRQRGCQLALLEHRIRDAAQRGCDLVVTDTLGDNESQRNVERAGLRPLYRAGWWVLPLAGAPAPTTAKL